MRLQALSLGSKVDVWTPRAGVVHSGFAGAINLLMAGELWTVLGAAKHDLPFGIRLAPGGLPDRSDMPAAGPVHVRAGYVAVDQSVLDCRCASVWAPMRWRPPADGIAQRLFVAERAAADRAWAESAGMALDVTHALHRTGAAADALLAAAVRRTVGRGPGLTPAGDDVLVGMLAVLTSGAAGPVGERSVARLAGALAPVLSATTDISRHLLGQALRGLPGRALHDLGRAVVEGADEAGLARALEPVLDTGATSGADACVGLVAAARLLFTFPERVAA